jgi:hypothetical protein
VVAVPKKDCRESSDLCTADEAFTFDLGATSDVSRARLIGTRTKSQIC